MAVENTGPKVPFVADGAISQRRIVTVGASDNAVAQATGDTAALVGVALDDYSDGEAATIQVTGVAKIEAGASITRGAMVTSNGSGQATTLGTTAGTRHAIGIALESGASGEVISVLLAPTRVVI